ncbi:DUF397 domain-containing protein [Nocardia sp. R7R-8]|uniref:DUF397 domain-containing protein n=1 Tax=Nocardia sp. R7R-8 TaxID=3459304 RepID=UPI00403D80A6
MVGVRDSKNPTGPALFFAPGDGTPSPQAWPTASSTDRHGQPEMLRDEVASSAGVWVCLRHL